MTRKEQLYHFLEGTGPDKYGRMLKDIWFYSNQQLEYCHNYIQWMFPTDKISLYNPWAPTLTQDDLLYFKTDKIQKNMMVSLNIMLEFYGFIWDGDKIVFLDANREHLNYWMYPDSHNYLRITRILKSLKLFGLEDLAEKFFIALDSLYAEYPNRIGKSINYWKEA